MENRFGRLVRRFTLVLLIAALLLPSVSFGAGISVAIDGKAVVFTSSSGSPFVDGANRTQVPFRQTMEAFGAAVSWESASRTAVAVKDGITVRVPIGSSYILRNGVRIPNDTAALIRDGRTYLPIRAVLEAFGAAVSWNATLQRVDVTTHVLAPSVVFPAGEYFSTQDLSDGLLHVSYKDGGKLKLIIEKGTSKYTYDVNSAGRVETFPLQLGNGTYKASLYKNTSGTSYRLLSSKSLNLQLSDPNAVYLASIQIINWGVDSRAVAKAVELTKDAKTVQDKARLLWNYMVRNNSYDYEKAASVQSGYIPVVDQVLADRKGICYDFSSLYAAMLRSQGTPAKLIKGYAPQYASGYHAWNEVYDTAQGKWIVVDTTYDLQIYARNKDVTMVKNATEFNKLYEY